MKRFNLGGFMRQAAVWAFVVASAGMSLPAVGGPDWQLLEQAREAGRVEAEKQVREGAPRRLALPLDHGPRAQTTPWLNQQRLKRAEEEARRAEGQARPAPQK